MILNKILWRYKGIFANPSLLRLITGFLFIYILTDIISKTELQFTKYFLAVSGIMIVIGICVENFFEAEIIKKPKEINKEVKKK